MLQAASHPATTIIARRFNILHSNHPENHEFLMTLLLLEALGALLIFVFIIWWTMFSGRKNGELKDDTGKKPADERAKK